MFFYRFSFSYSFSPLQCIFSLFDDVAEGLPNLHHGVGVKFAIFQQVAARDCLLFGWHILDCREYAHCFTAVVYAVKIVIIEFGIIWEHGRQHRFDRERAADFLAIIVSAPKHVEQIFDVVPYVEQMCAQVGKHIGKFLYARALKRLVVGKRAYVHGDILHKALGNGAERICAGHCQELFVFERTAFTLDIMQGILKRYLLIRSHSLKRRNDGLHCFKVQKVQRIRERGKKLLDAVLVCIHSAIMQIEVNLLVYFVGKIPPRARVIFKRNNALLITFKGFRLWQTIHIKHARLGKMLRAIFPKSALVGCKTVD